MKVLSIDPGFRILGYSILEKKNEEIKLLIADEFVNKKQDLSSIYDFVIQLVNDYAPTYAAIEKTFINCNPKTSIILSQAQGVCLLAFEKMNIKSLQITPTAVKKHLCQKGNANKKHIQNKVKEIFNQDFRENAADAIAIGIYLLCENPCNYKFIDYRL
jgi:crossover junction endodeoxyribonuclease RuvC